MERACGRALISDEIGEKMRVSNTSKYALLTASQQQTLTGGGPFRGLKGVRASRHRRLAAACTAALLSSAALPAARAADIYWANPVSGNFSTAANWGPPAVVPGSGDIPHLNAYDSAGDPYTVTLTGNVTNAGLAVTAVNTTITVNLNSYTWTQTNAIDVGRASQRGSALNLGNGSMVTTIPAGAESDIGQNAGESGIVDLDSLPGDPAASWTHNGTLGVGASGNGTLSVGGRFVENGFLMIGKNAGSVGALNVGGNGNTINGSDVWIGGYGTGSLSVGSSGSLAVSNHNTLFGVYAGSNGSATIEGNFSSGYVYVGNAGAGSEELNDVANEQVNGDLVLGTGTGSTGAVSMDNEYGIVQIIIHNPSIQPLDQYNNAILNVTGNEVLGVYATGSGSQPGSLFRQAEGSNTASTVTMAQFAGSTSVYQMSAGTLTSTGNIVVGSAGTASFNQAGGTVTITSAAGALRVGDLAGGVGSYTLGSGATLNAPFVIVGYQGTGTFNQMGGSLNSTYAVEVEGGSTGSTAANYFQTAGTSTMGNFYVGYAGYANANVSGGTMSVGSGVDIGVANTAGGVMSFKANLSTGSMTVGDAGDGQFNQSGGTLTLTPGFYNQPGPLIIGNTATGIGYFYQSGGNSSIGTLTVGNAGMGLLNLSAGTMAVSGGMTAGAQNGSYGQVNVLGGSLPVGTVLTLGSSGTGRLLQNASNISIGAGGNAPALILGSANSSFGSYFLASGNLSVNGSVFVGASGSGFIQQDSGSDVIGSGIPNSLYIGHDSGGMGEYALEGGTLSDNGDEIVGWYGSGTIIQNVGGNTVGSTTSPWHLYVGFQNGSTGTYELVGSGTLVVNGDTILGNNAGGSGTFLQTAGNVSTGTLTVGNAGVGLVNVSGGSMGVSGALTIGSQNGSRGTLNVTGGTFNAPSMTLAGSPTAVAAITYGGTGSILIGSGSQPASGNVLIAAGATVTTLGTATISGPGQLLNAGTLNVSSGSLTYTNTGQSSFFQNSGVISVTGNATFAFGVGANGYIPRNFGTITVAVGSTLSIPDALNNETGTCTVNGSINGGGFNNFATVTISGPQTWAVGSPFNNFAGTATFNTDAGANGQTLSVFSYVGGSISFTTTQHLFDLYLDPAALVTLTNAVAGTRSLLVTEAFNDLGTLNLTAEAMDWQAGAAGGLAQVATEIKQGYTNGTWTGTGITSSSAAANTAHLTALGYMLNNQSGTALYTASNPFEGFAPAANDVLVKYTYYGDADLNGKVDGTDYSRIDNGALNHLTGWFNGDFNYDGIINGSDYTLIDNSYNTQGALMANELASPNAVATAQIAGLAGISAVPEPTTLGLVAMGTLCLLGRRLPIRRKSDRCEP